jgi:hypothetical protein
MPVKERERERKRDRERERERTLSGAWGISITKQTKTFILKIGKTDNKK